MFDSPRYIKNSFAISFERQPTVRRKANELEDILKDQYAQPQIISVPDDLDPEVPRLIFGSQHGFSQIVVSQLNVTLNVQYSADWQQDISKGREYLLERASILFKLLDTLEEAKPYFSGLVTIVRLHTDADERTMLDSMAKLLAFDIGTKDLHDVHLKTTTVVSDRFFSNITFRNYRLWKVSPDQQGLQRLSRRNPVEQGIEILGDFNDRYMFNEKTDYFSNQDAMKLIINQGLDEVRRATEEVKELHS